jgi:aldehyde dehydrogenase (NAD+)
MSSRLEAQLTSSDPFSETTYQGPQVSQTQYDRIMNYVECGVQEGATIITGGKRHGKAGYFIEPVSHLIHVDELS